MSDAGRRARPRPTVRVRNVTPSLDNARIVTEQCLTGRYSGPGHRRTASMPAIDSLIDVDGRRPQRKGSLPDRPGVSAANSPSTARLPTVRELSPAASGCRRRPSARPGVPRRGRRDRGPRPPRHVRAPAHRPRRTAPLPARHRGTRPFRARPVDRHPDPRCCPTSAGRRLGRRQSLTTSYLDHPCCPRSTALRDGGRSSRRS